MGDQTSIQPNPEHDDAARDLIWTTYMATLDALVADGKHRASGAIREAPGLYQQTDCFMAKLMRMRHLALGFAGVPRAWWMRGCSGVTQRLRDSRVKVHDPATIL
jgi:hypothetical protein